MIMRAEKQLSHLPKENIIDTFWDEKFRGMKMNFYAKSKKHILKYNEKEKVEKVYSDLIEEMADILSKAEIAALENEKNNIINDVYEEQKTLREHLDETVECAEKFFEQYGKYFTEKEKNLIYIACKYHDVGKANLVFQAKLSDGGDGKYKNITQVPHGFLSALTLSFAALIYGLKTISQMGGKFAIMTATLPPVLLDFMNKYGLIKNETYCFEDFSAENVMQRHMIKLYEQEFNLEEIAEESKTKKVLVICNTVKKAQETYRLLEEYTDNVYSLHARYIKKHRKMLEKNIMQFSENRESIGIWVTTQIVEASLDIDFDILYTEMCTADSLLQRMGRCNRKGRYIPSKPNIKIYKTENAKRQVKNRINNTGIYYRDLFERSWECMGDYENQLFTEEQKINYINEVYDTEKIVNTEYYKEIEAYLEYFQKLSVNELSKMDGKKKFRMIESVSVMPDKIYNENEDLIEKYQSEIYDRHLGREAKEILKTKLDELTLSVTIYNKYSKEGIEGVIEKTDIHRTDFVYDFDEETGKGIGLSKTEREGNIL